MIGLSAPTALLPVAAQTWVCPGAGSNLEGAQLAAVSASRRCRGAAGSNRFEAKTRCRSERGDSAGPKSSSGILARRRVAAAVGAIAAQLLPSRRRRAEAADQSTRKVAMITGASTGIGKATAAGLAQSGRYRQIYLAGHNQSKHEKAIADLRSTAGSKGSVDFLYLPLELSELKSIRNGADLFRSFGVPLDTLICNAAVMAVPERRTTTDGYEFQMEVNYLSHFLLINLLLPDLIAAGTAADPSRIISVSSSAHFVKSPLGFGDAASLNLDGPEGSSAAYYPWTAYGQSKLAQVMFTYELDRRLKAKGLPVTANVLDPGFVDTELQRYLPAQAPGAVMSFLAKTPERGAETSVALATRPDGIESGGYWVDAQRALSLGKGASPFPLNKELAVEGTTSYDQATWEALWRKSARLVGLRETI